MWEEVEYELEELKRKVNNNQMEGANIFFDESDWEDEHSHNEIEELQRDFVREAEKYLNEVGKDKYIVSHGGWCVHVFTKEYYEEKIVPYYRKR